MEKLVYSSSPHIKSPRNTRRIMIDVCIAMVPACVAGCVLFGWNAIITLAIACVAAVACEFVYRLCCKVPLKKIVTEFDFTSLVTGMLVGMNMPATVIWYVPLFASVFAIAIVKMLFGGTGKNIVNPAIAGRVFVFLSFMKLMTAYPIPNFGGIAGGSITSGATPLGSLIGGGNTVSTLTNLDLFLGTGVPGVLGETCKIALLAGGVYLIIRKVLNFRWPLVYMGTAGLIGALLAITTHETMTFTLFINDFLKSILSGGLVLGAVFMATDFVTTPDTKAGNYVYFVMLGILTAVLRYFTKSEVVSFSILFMNLLVPLFDKFIVNKPFGFTGKQKEAKNG